MIPHFPYIPMTPPQMLSIPKEYGILYEHYSLFSKGDTAEGNWIYLLDKLHEGWEIINGTADGRAVHYILRKVVEKK